MTSTLLRAQGAMAGLAVGDARLTIQRGRLAVDQHQRLARNPAGLFARDPNGVLAQQGDLHITFQLDGLTIADHGGAGGADADVGLAAFEHRAAWLASLSHLTGDVVAGFRTHQVPGRPALGILLFKVQRLEHKRLGGRRPLRLAADAAANHQGDRNPSETFHGNRLKGAR